MRKIIFVLLMAAAALAIFRAPARAGFDDQFMVSDDIGQDKVPHMGFSRILVVPLIIDDVPAPDMARWKNFFANKLDAFTFKNYWNVNSLGRYDVEVTMAEPVHYPTCPLPANFKNCAVPRGDANALEPGLKFVKDLLTRVKTESHINFADFDVNGPNGTADGWVDGIIVMPNASFPGVALPISLFKTLRIDGVKVGAVAIAGLNEKEVVAVHEFGHLLGFGDLYHEQKPGRGLHLSLMGQYSDDSIPLIDAYSRVKIGWADLIDIPEGTAPKEYVLTPAFLSGKVIRAGREKEFFLIENRAPDKYFDADIKAPGLAVYHVDETTLPIPGKWSFIQLIQHCLNCDEWRPLIMNVPPDGKYTIQMGDLKKVGDLLFHKGQTLQSDYANQNPLNETNPALNTNWYSAEPSDVKIFDIDDATDLLPAIKVKVGFD